MHSAVVALATLVVAILGADEFRTWTDRSGEHTVEAEIQRLESGAVVLRKFNGRTVRVPLERLSDADQEFIRQWASAEDLDGGAVDGPAGDEPSDAPRGSGLRAWCYADQGGEKLALTRIDPQVDFTFDQQPAWPGGPKEHFLIRWSGWVVPRFSEEYTLKVTCDDGALVWLDDELVIQAWKEQGPTEYQARVPLVAGRRHKLRLLYFNAWFAGSVKLAWQSRSQPAEVIPAAALFPAPEVPELPTAPAALEPSLAEQITIETLSLPAAVRNNPDGIKQSLVLCPRADGTARLGWNDTAGKLHLTRLAADWSVDRDVSIPDVDLRGLVVDDDGSTSILMAQMPNRMWVMRLDPQGKLAYRTLLVGDKGREAGGHFLDDHFSFAGRFAGNGPLVAAHFAHSWNTGEGGTHQGGWYGTLDPTGKVVQKEEWTVSHSLDQRLLVHRGAFLTLSAGDCFPKGLWFQNRTLGIGRVTYPPEDQREAFGNCAGFVNASLGSLVPVGPRVALACITRRTPESSPEIVYQLLEEDGELLAEAWLTETPEAEERSVRLVPYGEGRTLVVWRDAAGTTRLGRIDAAGHWLDEPAEVPARLSHNDDPVTLADGSVVWLDAADGQSEVRVVRITPPAR
jgi:hypothetical protein